MSFRNNKQSNDLIAGLNSDEDLNNLFVVGLNYRSSGISARESVAVPPQCLTAALTAITQLPSIKEAVLLSTCNRTEVYAIGRDVTSALVELDLFFSELRKRSEHSHLRLTFQLFTDDAVKHVFRVASGLDSMVLGDEQILSQVRVAYNAARSIGACGTVLDRVMQSAIRCGKRVRAQTQLSRRPTSLSSVAVETCNTLLGNENGRRALVIGGGKMSRICAELLLRETRYSHVSMVTRDSSTLVDFAQTLSQPEKFSYHHCFSDRYHLMSESDAVFVATSAPNFVVEAGPVLSSNRPLIIFDLSVPRNVDPALTTVASVQLLDCDEMYSRFPDKFTAQKVASAQAENIVLEMLDQYKQWQIAYLAAPAIHALCASSSGRQLSADGTNPEIDKPEHKTLHEHISRLRASSSKAQLQQELRAISHLFAC